MIFFKNYPYAPKATFVSVLFSLIALFFAYLGIGTVLEFYPEQDYASCIIGVLLALPAIPLYIFGSRKLSKKIAEKEGPKNIRTKAKYALKFVRDHPEQYEQVASDNPEFARKYVRDAFGKIVKR